MKYDVSVVLTLHNEGRIAHRSFKGISWSMAYAAGKGVSVELVVIMDRVTDALLNRIVGDWVAQLKENAILLPVDFGALSLSRNHGIEHSHGEIIAILDGDDLFCENWIYKAYKTCSANPNHIAHPEATYYFPYERFVRFANGRPEAVINLIIYNQWTALTAAHRDIFCKIKYVKDVPPYAFQDWLWNCDTACQGYRHVTVPETVLAIRQKPVGKSLWQNTHSQNKIVRTNIHFRNIFLRKYDLLNTDIPADGESVWFADKWYKFRKSLADYFYRRCPNIFPVLVNLRRQYLEKIRSAGRSNRLPPWLTSELKHMAQIEPSIQADRNIDIRRPDMTGRMRHAIIPPMAALVGAVKAKVYILDDLDDKRTALNAFNFMDPQKSSFLITTEKSKLFPASLAQNNMTHIPIGNSKLFFEERLQLLHRLLLETDVEWIHIIGSRIGYTMFNRYKKTFDGLKIFATLLSPTGDSSDFGWEIVEYPELFDSYSGISTDTEPYRNRILDVYGGFRSEITRIGFQFAPELYSRLYEPTHGKYWKSTGKNPENTRIAGQIAEFYKTSLSFDGQL